ncbi:MAG TPA: hypothetical protein VGZ00_00675 [Candidatus Baltobacteraceae bacterium]|nr:hypothetical protein [Candidatus Baltobacteraceae bacterium]
MRFHPLPLRPTRARRAGKKIDAYGAHADVYAADGKPEIVLPRTDRLGDYATVLSKLLSIFADVTDRDEITIYRDLIGVDRDVVRFRSFGGEDVDADVNIKGVGNIIINENI